mmetsp:Transcript_6241/g.21426  ORF Transcript_6241/g.21426 Transcript_6241/m.21426 type:complete len:91 (+) Transcript_6241:1328-1600(+)
MDRMGAFCWIMMGLGVSSHGTAKGPPKSLRLRLQSGHLGVLLSSLGRSVLQLPSRRRDSGGCLSSCGVECCVEPSNLRPMLGPEGIEVGL